MKKPSFKILPTVYLIALGTGSSSIASVNRIRSVHFDKGRVERISMVPGLASVVTFPCDIDEAIVGREQDLKALVSPTTKKKQLTLFLSSGASQSTNLLVRCGDKKDLFVFDVISNRTIHQDVFKVRAFSGGPEVEDPNLKEIDSSEFKMRTSQKKGRSHVIEVKPPMLIEEKK